MSETISLRRARLKDLGSTREDLAPSGEPRLGGEVEEGEVGFLSCTRAYYRAVGSTGGCALADTAAKTPPGRQGLANITGQQCADRHHATRLLLRGDSRQHTRAPSPRKLAKPRQQVVRCEKKKVRRRASSGWRNKEKERKKKERKKGQ